MILGVSALSYAIYKDKNRKTPPELFKPSSKEENAALITAAIILLIIEIILLFYAISIAMKFSQTKTQLFLNLFLAIAFTTPYVFFNVLINNYVPRITI